MKSVTKMGAVAALPVVVMSMQVDVAVAAQRTKELAKPNVILYMIEDTSPQYLALYNDGKGAQTPNLTKLSQESIIYNNAFSNAPVSSAARTTLITGCYAPRFGGSLHRRLEELPMPEGLRMFPSYLREAGYYTLNVSKTDYNVVLDKTAWDQIKGKLGDWRNRKEPSQPFFMQRSQLVTHESQLLFSEEQYKTVKTKCNPDSVYIHPSLPSTELMKYTYATFYDRIAQADEEFGQMIEMLREDGLMDNTFIFFCGDNGGCVPESKGYTNDVGFRVPLVVYVPEKWRDVVGIPVGEHHDGIVSFMDFGATILNLAGIETPPQSNGRPFLGEGSEPGRESQICYGDRFDDLYAFNRALYKGDYRYARNYIPYHTRGLHAYYRYKSLAFQQSREMFHDGELSEAQAKFFEMMGVEELYDIKNDPDELNNLVGDPKYSAVLKSMREDMATQLDNYCDLGFLPETIIQEEAMANPATYGEEHARELSTYRKVADLQIEQFSKSVLKSLHEAVDSQDIVESWWGLTTAGWFAQDVARNKAFVAKVKRLTGSANRSFIRSRAFVAMGRFEKGLVDEVAVKEMLANARTLGETLLVLNDMAYMSESGTLPQLNLLQEDVKFSDYSVVERIKYLNRDR